MPDIALYTQSIPTDEDGKLSVRDIKSIVESIPAETKLIFYVSSFHFGRNEDGSAYLHLNDTDVKDLDYFFRALIPLWTSQVEFRIMLGGAGGAYNALYTDYSAFMNLLLHFFKKYPFITGIDLDIEEELHPDAVVSLERVKQIINDIEKGTSREFAITMAPVASSLIDQDTIGMGGFCYWDLQKSSEWNKLEGLNIQAYGQYSASAFKQIVSTGYKPHQLRMGMLGDQFQASNDFEQALNEIEKIGQESPDLLGTILWETGDTKINAELWSHAMARILNSFQPKTFFSREIAWNLW